MSTRIIVIRNEDDRDFDRYVVVPKGMTMSKAVKKVDAAIRKVKATGHYEGYLIDAALEVEGLELATWMQAEEEV